MPDLKKIASDDPVMALAQQINANSGNKKTSTSILERGDVMYIKEGGNVFKDADGAIATTRINQTDVKPTVQWLEQLTGLPLMDNMLGSTGQKPTSGDLDLAVDPKTIGKDDLVAKLTKWAESHGFDPKEWIRKSGVSVHFKAPITGREDRGYIQTDFMFVQKPDFSQIFNES